MFGHFFISRSFNIILFLQGLARVAAIMANGGSLQGNNVFINQFTTCFVSLENSLTPLSQRKGNCLQVRRSLVLQVGMLFMGILLRGNSSQQVSSLPRCKKFLLHWEVKRENHQRKCYQGGVCQFEDEVSPGRGGYFGWMGFGGCVRTLYCPCES